jgi:hypothetical protein
MHPLEMVVHLVLTWKRASTALLAAIAAVNRAPKACDLAIVLRSIVTLEVGEAVESVGTGAASDVAFVFVVLGGPIAEDIADDRWFGNGGDVVRRSSDIVRVLRRQIQRLEALLYQGQGHLFEWVLAIATEAKLEPRPSLVLVGGSDQI